MLTLVWTDQSPLWTPEFKADVNYSNKPDDGLFWMAYEDFLKFFSGINVCRVYYGEQRHLL